MFDKYFNFVSHYVEILSNKDKFVHSQRCPQQLEIFYKFLRVS